MELHLRIAAPYVYDVVAQRVQKLKGSVVVPLVVLHHSLAHGNADGPGRLVLVVVSRLPAETWQREGGSSFVNRICPRIHKALLPNDDSSFCYFSFALFFFLSLPKTDDGILPRCFQTSEPWGDAC